MELIDGRFWRLVGGIWRKARGAREGKQRYIYLAT